MNMTILPQFRTSEKSMSSMDISELVQSRHDKVKQSIERLIERGVIIQPPMGNEQSIDTIGRSRSTQVYVFSGEQGKRDSIIVVAQLCPEFTARLVDRWQELENSQSRVPKSFSEALQLAADQARQLELAAPKVKYFDAIVERSTLLNATQVAQKIGLSALSMNKLLDQFNVYSRGIKRARVFQQWFVDKGFGELKQTELGFSQPMFTTKGEAWVVEKLVSEGVAV